MNKHKALRLTGWALFILGLGSGGLGLASNLVLGETDLSLLLLMPAALLAGNAALLASDLFARQAAELATLREAGSRRSA